MSDQLKCYINPTYKNPDTRADGGIRRVTEAMWKELPKFNITPTDNLDEADVLNCHGATLVDNLAHKPLVTVCHGLYWAEYQWDAWAHETNAYVTEALRRADRVICPSHWVANALTRGMMIEPTVIHHGVYAEQFEPSRNPSDYVLWNKARKDAVSDPEPLERIAQLMVGRDFVTTIGNPTSNVKVIGVVPYDKMKEWVRNAGLLLVTSRETFGIGTLEAMAAGVPVVGWDYGGQSEIIRQGETGVLVKPYDYDELGEAIEWALAHRKRLGENAREDVKQRWDWESKIARYAEVIRAAHAHSVEPRPKVSVVVTNYNLLKYLPDALKSVEQQSLGDFECVVVDDGSTDGSQDFIHDWCVTHRRFVYCPTPMNLKLSGAKNWGNAHTLGKYLISLDADDLLEENALKTLSEALDQDPSIAIAFGHLDVMSEDGSNRQRNPWPVKEFSWHQQMAHLNQLPYSSMIRREVFERSGGLRRRCWRAEDAEFWCRVTSFGFRPKKVTEASTLIYRLRNDSKSRGEPGDGDWTAWFGWRICGDPHETVKNGLDRIPPDASIDWPTADLVPWGAVAKPPARFGGSWRVSHHAHPKVSVIIPVGPNHEQTLIDALDSLMGQTFGDWEAVVVNDTGHAWSGDEGFLRGFRWARIVNQNSTSSHGSGWARNRGCEAARAEAITFLDADDFLLPGFLETCVRAWNLYHLVIYTDWLAVFEDPKRAPEPKASEDFQIGAVLKQMQHGITVLMLKKMWKDVGGFDETMEEWEDWDFFIRLQAAGYCSRRIAEVLFGYRITSGSRRENARSHSDELRAILFQKWKSYYEGSSEMG